MKRWLLLLPLALLLRAEPERCTALKRRGQAAEAASCFRALTRSGGTLERAQAYASLNQYQEANSEFRKALQEQPDSAAVKTAWGDLYLKNDQPQDAAKLFQEALQSDSNYAPAYLGLSRALSQGYDDKAVALAKEALKHNRGYFQAHEFLGYLALEVGDQALAASEAQKSLQSSPDALDGLAVLAAIDFLMGDGEALLKESPWMDRILKIDPTYGEAFQTAAHFFEINYRYSEAIEAYRKALALNPGLLQARSRLGVNLMRLGQTDEARTLLEQCFNAHFRNAETVNSLRFLDTLNQYERVSMKSADLLLNRSEAALLKPYVEPELQRAMATYERKYKMTLPARVRLEVYPNHDDFVVRTLGLPGQGGLLGVTFNTVVAMDSPVARPAGDFSWADTMWHELCHVYVISATHHLVPRWFSEGLAVHEEGVVSPLWGNRLTPDTVAALKQKKLLPVLDLDSGFVRPQYPGQVLVSYYQAGQICDFIAHRWGDDAILAIIHSYAAHKTTEQALDEDLHTSASAFDKDFQAWLNTRTANTVAHFDEWKEGMKAAAADLKNGAAARAVDKIMAVRAYFPDYAESYQLLAKAYTTLNKKPEAMDALEQYRERGGTGVEPLKQLSQMQADAGRPEDAIRTLQELNLIFPQDSQVHQRLGSLLLKRNRPGEAVREFRSVLALKPADAAASHLDLAQALNAAHQTSEAKDEVLLALEAAPNYKPAQQLLLQLSQ